MAYLGRGIENLSDRVVLDDITTSATATYNLTLNSVAFVPSSAESLTCSVNGVVQKCGGTNPSFTVSGSQIIFSSALTSSDSIDFIIAERGITLQTPSAGSVNTDQLAASAVTNAKIASDAAIATSKLGTGAVLQVVQTVDTTNRSSNSTSIVSSGVELNITPSSTSNKIYLHADFSVGLNTDNRRNHKFTFLRDTTDLTPTGVNALHNPVFTGTNALFHLHPVSMSFLDSPSTTSQITYKLAWSINADTHYLGRRGQDTGHDAPTILTAMEIAG